MQVAPEAIRETAMRVAGGFRIREVKLEEDRDEGGQVYDVEGKADGKEYDLIIALDGRLIEVDGPDGKKRFDDAPAGRPVPNPAPVAEREIF